MSNVQVVHGAFKFHEIIFSVCICLNLNIWNFFIAGVSVGDMVINEIYENILIKFYFFALLLF